MNFYITFTFVFLTVTTTTTYEIKGYKEISISKGKIRGLRVLTSRNISANIFLGIHYAESPGGRNRWRLPVAKTSWRGTVDAASDNKSCVWKSTQNPHTDPFIIKMTEDCLYVNVFTNSKCLKVKNCSIIFYIHGGNFMYSSPHAVNKDFVIDNYLPENRSVIMVIPAYRLGLFGYLNLSPQIRTSAIKNIQLHDLIAALRWVQDEIQNFGGNAKHVTLMGHSSGATDANLLTMSPLAKGLYQQAIIFGGGVILPITYAANQAASQELAIASGCAMSTLNLLNVSSVEDVIHCLRKKDAFTLITIQEKLKKQGLLFQGPCIEFNDGVLPEPVKILRQKRHRINIFTGTTKHESRNTAYILKRDGSVNDNLLYKECSEMLKTMGIKKPELAVSKCTSYYHKPERTPHIRDDATMYLAAVLNAEDITEKGGKAFLHEYQYEFAGSAFNYPHQKPGDPHPMHVEHLLYLLGHYNGNFTEKDETIRKKFSQIIVNFANKGDPSLSDQKFELFDKRLKNYFVVDLDGTNNMPGMQRGFHADAFKLWNELLPKLGDGTNDPPDADYILNSTEQNEYGVMASKLITSNRMIKNVLNADVNTIVRYHFTQATKMLKVLEIYVVNEYAGNDGIILPRGQCIDGSGNMIYNTLTEQYICYLLLPLDQYTHEGANAECSRFTYTLASLTDLDEYHFLKENYFLKLLEAEGRQNWSVLIGLKRIRGEIQWTDGTDAKFISGLLSPQEVKPEEEYCYVLTLKRENDAKIEDFIRPKLCYETANTALCKRVIPKVFGIDLFKQALINKVKHKQDKNIGIKESARRRRDQPLLRYEYRGECPFDSEGILVFFPVTQKENCYYLLPEPVSENTLFEDIEEACKRKGNYHLLTLHSNEELHFIKENYFKKLESYSEMQYFLLGLTTYYGNLEWTDESDIEYIKEKLIKNDVNYEKDGCYLYAHGYTKDHIKRVSCDRLKNSHVICQYNSPLPSNLVDNDSDDISVGQAMETPDHQTEQEATVSDKRPGIPGCEKEPDLSHPPVKLLLLCALLGFCFGAVTIICIMKFKKVLRALSGKSEGGDGKEAEEGEGKKGKSGKEKEKKAKDSEVVKEENEKAEENPEEGKHEGEEKGEDKPKEASLVIPPPPPPS